MDKNLNNVHEESSGNDIDLFTNYFDDDNNDNYADNGGSRNSRGNGAKRPTGKVRIRWSAVAMLALIIILFVLLIVLIMIFKDEITKEVHKNDSSEQDVPAVVTTAPPVTTSETTTTTTTESSEVEPTSPFPVETDITVIDGVTYINGILIVNKTYSVPESFDPGVDPVAEAKLLEMYDAAARDGLTLWTASGYRTYDYQRELYEAYAATDGYDAADTYSARPGHSEHETGLTFDVNDPTSAFDDTPEAQWLKEHCAEYGFIIRYPKGKEDITGFMYESWHVRYVGEEIAKVIMENDICLEEYFGITSEYPD